MSDSAQTAYARIAGNRRQPLSAHLEGTALLASGYAKKIRLPLLGELMGLLHDLGKYSPAFQAYLQEAHDTSDDGPDTRFSQKGSIDHSTAGGQFVWERLSNQGLIGAVLAQTLSLCIASHHSGLIDCLHPALNSAIQDAFSQRMAKPDEKSHLHAALKSVDSEILDRASNLLSSSELVASFERVVRDISIRTPGKTDRDPIAQIHLALVIRFLFSCLIDSDRSDSAQFAWHEGLPAQKRAPMDWDPLIQRLECHLEGFEASTPVDDIRKSISEQCRGAASCGKGIRTLTVPTGGGKTLAGLRFALHHARKHGMDRIISFIPFTSIIDQNADVARRILEPDGVLPGSIVLEHHSNLTPELQPPRSRLLSENWDAPVIYTTLVQFLEALFGHGTRGVRRMHRMANSVLIFDEIQSLPINCIHLFNNAVNFLAEQCGCTVVLCTATQPLLHRVNPDLGAIQLSAQSEIVTNVPKFFNTLKRVEILDERVPNGYCLDNVTELARHEVSEVGSCLVVVNTKKTARNLCRAYTANSIEHVYHLSTSMCPAHRREVLRDIKENLAHRRPTVCFSTQLIEAGVDIDFGSVIRSQAGLDSIAQSAGRCNRHGSMASRGRMHIINLQGENLSMLPDIRQGRDKTDRVLNEFRSNPERFGHNCIGPEAMAWYYENYFFSRADEMAYPLSADKLGYADTLLNLLSGNPLAVEEYKRINKRHPGIYFRQSFMTAGKLFEPISSLARGVLIPYRSEGHDLVHRLQENSTGSFSHGLLRTAQQFSVNVFPRQLDEMMQAGIIREIQADTGILFLTDIRYYSSIFGLSQQPEA